MNNRLLREISLTEAFATQSETVGEMFYFAEYPHVWTSHITMTIKSVTRESVDSMNDTHQAFEYVNNTEHGPLPRLRLKI